MPHALNDCQGSLAPKEGCMQADQNPTLTPLDAAETIADPLHPVAEAAWTTRLAPRLKWLLTWGTKGSLALADQALFAGAQFVLNILLARWLAPAEYGTFAVAYSVFLLVSAVYSAILLEPMIVFGSGRYLEKRRTYLGIVLRGHWLLTVATGVILVGGGLLEGRVNSQSVGHALCALGLALPLILFAWLTRWAFYIELRPGRAAAGSAIYFIGLLALAWWMHAGRILSPTSAILAMGAAGLLTASLQLLSLRSRWSGSGGELPAGSVASEHWSYGRWALASALAAWIAWNLYYFVLPFSSGLAAAGTLKALLNLATPATHSLVAFGALVLPLVVRHRERGGLVLMRRTVRHVTGMFVGGSAVYLVFLWVCRVQIIRFLYGGKYIEYAGLPVLLIGLVPLATACGTALGSALRACLRPDLVFWGYLAASVAALGIGLKLALSWGVVGALSGYLASYITLAVALCVFYQGSRREITSV